LRSDLLAAPSCWLEALRRKFAVDCGKLIWGTLVFEKSSVAPVFRVRVWSRKVSDRAKDEVAPTMRFYPALHSRPRHFCIFILLLSLLWSVYPV
jgi:hypothetical protein